MYGLVVMPSHSLELCLIDTFVTNLKNPLPCWANVIYGRPQAGDYGQASGSGARVSRILPNISKQYSKNKS